METGNYVAQLNEYGQKTGSNVQYEDLGSAGPGHNKVWVEDISGINSVSFLIMTVVSGSIQ